MQPWISRIWRAGLRLTTVVGAASISLLVWLLAGWPLGVDRWLDVSGPPAKADAIVCIGGGMITAIIPTEDGWQRIFTTSQLFSGAYAPLVVFSGRGSGRVSEAEIYAGAAAWLGVPREAMLLDASPQSTADHASTLIQASGGRITRQSQLLLVTSRPHSRRVLLAFRKQGFVNARVVAIWHDEKPPILPGHPAASAVPGFTPSRKSYDDPLRRLSERFATLMVAARESAAIAWYKWRRLA